MTHELAKELNDAGFPQGNRGSYWIKRHGKMRQIGGKEIYSPQHWVLAPFIKGAIKGLERTLETAYVPTLSELIEACGTEFPLFFEWRLGFNNWRVSTYRDGQGTETYGPDLDTAAARLWLALNGKK